MARFFFEYFAPKDFGAPVVPVLDSPLRTAPHAVVDADPLFFRARLIELAAMVARGHASDVAVKG